MSSSSCNDSDVDADDVDWKRRAKRSRPTDVEPVQSAGYSSNSSCQTVTSSHSSRSGLGQCAAPAPSTTTVASQTSRHSASVTERHHAHAEAVGSCSTAALTGHPHGVMPALQGKGILGEHPFTDRGGNLEAQSRLCHHLHIRYDMDTEHFINIVEQYLGEPPAKRNHLKVCIGVIGIRRTVRLLVDTDDTMRTGGMDTQNHIRKRTAGGVFYTLMKKAPFIRPSEQSEITAHEKEAHKLEAKRKRKQKQTEDRARQAALFRQRTMNQS
ncbi:uncharacterized protein LOC135809943 [Sycon ciliatum]|uniref:uncharacterized protein LOC135809943 n=1 Tax=Sycon ciliatum TaxID=27933 RepID=UPI0031F6EA41